MLSGVKSVTYFDSYQSVVSSYPCVSAITEAGDLYCWGYNAYGQVGNGTTESQLTPYHVLSGEKVKSVTCSSSHFPCILVITEAGDLYCWGDNYFGQVGNGKTENQLTPYYVLSGVKLVTSFDSCTSAITETGDLYCWGHNGGGQIGNGTTENQLTPVKVLSDVKSVSYSYDCVSAIIENGDLYCWGANYDGQVGNGTTESQLTPFKVSFEDSSDDIARFTLSETASGTLKDNTLTFSGHIYLKDGKTASSEEWQSIVNSINWSSSEPSVATDIKCKPVTDGNEQGDIAITVSVSLKSVGTATVTGTTANGLSSSCNIKVDDKSIVSSFFLDSAKTVTLGDTFPIFGTLTLNDDVEVTPELTKKEVDSIRWTSSDQNILEDSNIKCSGSNTPNSHSINLMLMITPKKEGTVTLTGTIDGITKSCVVIVGKYASILSFEFADDYNLKTTTNGIKDLNINGVVTFDEDGDMSEEILDKIISWSSSNTAIADISKKTYDKDLTSNSAAFNIYITPKNTGTVVITGETIDGKKLSCKIQIGIDDFNFLNSYSYFNEDEGYYITSSDYKKLTKNLNFIDKDCIRFSLKSIAPYNYNVDGNELLHKKWNGSCYGISAWALLVNNGILKPSDIDVITSKLLCNISISNQVKSAINFYHFQQRLSTAEKQVDEFMSLKQIEQLNYLENLAKKCENGKNPVLIRYQWYKEFNDDETCKKNSINAHAVVGYGYEEGEWSFEDYNLTDKVFKKRILIYDCAVLPGNDDYYLYYNDDGTWYIPAKSIISTDYKSKKTKYNNGHFQLVTADTAAVNLVDYVTGSVKSNRSSNPGNNILTSLSDIKYNVNCEFGSADIDGCMVSNSTFSEDINVALEDSVTTDGIYEAGITSAFLPKSSVYKVSTSDDALNFNLRSSDYATTAISDSAGTIEFNGTKSVGILTEKETKSTLRITANEKFAGVDSYPTVEVSSDNTSELSLSTVDNGIIIKGNGLDALTVTGINYNTDDVELSVKSEKDSLLVSDIGNGIIAISEDSNNDGIYDNIIKSSNQIINNSPSPSPSIKPSGNGGNNGSTVGGGGFISGNVTVTTPTSTPSYAPVITLTPSPSPTPVITATTKPSQVTNTTPTPKPSASTTPGTGSDNIFNNNSKKEIISADVTLNKKSVIYNGKEKKPGVTVL